MIKYLPKKNMILVEMAKRGFNQKILSEVSKLNPSTISIFLNHGRAISPTTARKIAYALGCEINQLFVIEVNGKLVQ